MNKKCLVIALIAASSVFCLQCQENGIPQVPTAPTEIGSTISGDINIGLSKEQRTNLGALLNKLLADEYTLYVKTQNYHWNVSSPLFGQLHKMFQNQYEMLAKISDQVAERAVTLGIPAQATLAAFKQNSRIAEQSDIPNANTMIKNLLNDHESIIRTLRVDLKRAIDEYGDMGTSNFLTDLIEKHEKTAWMLRSSLEK